MKLKATFAAIAVSALGMFMPMSAEAFTTSCGDHSISIDRTSTSPRYYGGAESVMIHESGRTSYMLPSGNFLSITGTWRHYGSDIIVTHPDGSTMTYYDVFPIQCSYFY